MQDTIEHIRFVQQKIMDLASILFNRAINHDASKLKEPELSGYAGLADAMRGLTYGTPEHRAAFAPFKSIIAHHYENNDHHPEHFVGGVGDMNVAQLIEMLCDWKAASMRNSPSLAPSLDVSIKRFQIDDQLARIIKNTVRDLGW